MENSVASVLKAARRERRITLRSLSEKTGKAISFLSEIENGIRPIPKDESFLNGLSAFLGLSGVDIINHAKKERETQSPQRFKKLFFEDTEMLACWRRVSAKYEDDVELRSRLKKMLDEVEKGN